MERFTTSVAGVASGTDKTLINIFDPAATPIQRFGVYDIMVGSDDTPASQAARFVLGRTTAVGTEGSGLVPANLDPGGPAGACDSGLGAFGGEPTYTAAKTMLMFSLNQQATWRWTTDPMYAILATATQNNGLGLKTAASTSTQAHEACILFKE